MIDKTEWIPGFVVNTYDALNYDIDLPCIDKQRYKILDHIISNQYHYKNVLHGVMSPEQASESYRCRLNGIEINSKIYNRKQIKQYSYDVKNLIDSVDGHVYLMIKGTDIFNRLLVDIYIEPLNIHLCHYLLDKSSQDKNLPFVRYVNKSFKKLNYIK